MRLALRIDSATTEDVRHLAASTSHLTGSVPLWDWPGSIAAGCDGPNSWHAATPPLSTSTAYNARAVALVLRRLANHIEATYPTPED